MDRWYSSISISGSTDAAIASVVNNSGDANYVTHEAQLQSGDSGAPMFIDNGSGGLTMVGINWFIGNDGTNDLNGQSYLGNYDTEIQDFIEANTVPEMRHLALLFGLAIVVGVIWRRR